MATPKYLGGIVNCRSVATLLSIIEAIDMQHFTGDVQLSVSCK